MPPKEEIISDLPKISAEGITNSFLSGYLSGVHQAAYDHGFRVGSNAYENEGIVSVTLEEEETNTNNG